MLKELLSFIFDKAGEYVANQRPIKVDIPTDGRSQYWYINGELQDIEIDNPIVRYSTHSLPDFVTMAGRWIKEVSNNGDHLHPLGIFVGTDKIVMADTDQGPNRKTITMPLVQSELYKFVATCANQTVYLDQATLIRHLRTIFSSAPEASKMLTAAKSIVWKNTSIDSLKVDSGRESLGASVEREIVTGSEDGLGEKLTLVFDVFSNIKVDSFSHEIGIDVSIDHANKRIGLKASVDRLNELVMWTQSEIVSQIKSILIDSGHEAFAESGAVVIGSIQ